MEGVKKKTPTGITGIVILTIISGLILLTMSFFIFAVILPSGSSGILGAILGGGFLLVLGSASILVSIGLYKGKGWSWTFLLVLSGFGAAGYLLNIVNGNKISIAGLIINIIIIYYLYRPNVRRFFSKK
ncbi:MAG TPA: hypothetical protein VN704_03325 [Verrucomicrobiae bacterium]|nr:hypothetical protein [Verrucomicrobiae bacterium]